MVFVCRIWDNLSLNFFKVYIENVSWIIKEGIKFYLLSDSLRKPELFFRMPWTLILFENIIYIYRGFLGD